MTLERKRSPSIRPTSNRDWKRCTPRRPCRICGRPKYCGYIDDDLAICMWVESEHPTKNGGWRHGEGHWPRGVPFLPEPPKPRVPDFDATKWWKDHRVELATHTALGPLARKLNISIEALQAFGCVREGRDYAFPMKNGLGQIIGIRFRSLDGSQWAKTGSRAGLFLPIKINLWSDPVYICEGGSDAMAGHDLGLHTIGRPSAAGQEDLVKDYMFVNSIREAVIIADNDEPGQRGAEKLKQFLGGKVPILTLPTKDLREFKNTGGTKQLIESMVKRIAY